MPCFDVTLRRLVPALVTVRAVGNDATEARAKVQALIDAGEIEEEHGLSQLWLDACAHRLDCDPDGDGDGFEIIETLPTV